MVAPEVLLRQIIAAKNFPPYPDQPDVEDDATPAGHNPALDPLEDSDLNQLLDGAGIGSGRGVGGENHPGGDETEEAKEDQRHQGNKPQVGDNGKGGDEDEDEDWDEDGDESEEEEEDEDETGDEDDVANEDENEASVKIEVGNISLDSQGNATRGNRRSALRPDFTVAKSRPQLFCDQIHLYVELKNGKKYYQRHSTQIFRYINGIVEAIPFGFPYKYVVLMLIDAGTTYVWRITRETKWKAVEIWDRAIVMKTHSVEMKGILQRLSERN